MEFPNGFLEMIENDIKRIDSLLETGTDTACWELFRELDGRYQSCIKDFYQGMWSSNRDGTILYFNQLVDQPQSVADNLKIIKAKLETYKFGMNASDIPHSPSTQVNVTTNVNLNVTFEQARAKIEDMTSLTNEETQAVLEKIDEIEQVIKGNGSKKSKWEKVKPVLVWLADKSCDVGIALLPLLLQIS